MLIVTTVNKSDILKLKDVRFSPSFFYTKLVFKALEQKYEVKTLSDLDAEIISGSYIDTYVPKNKGLVFIRVGNIKPYNIDEDTDNLKYVNKDVPLKIITQKDDIISGRTQASTDKLGTASIISDRQAGCVISQHVSKITIKTISPYYLIAYLNSNFYKQQTVLATHGDTRVELTHSQLKDVKIVIPEQNVIADIDDKVRNIINYNEQALMYIAEAQKLFREKVIDNIDQSTSKYFTVQKSAIKSSNLLTPKYFYPLYMNTVKAIQERFETVTLGEIVLVKKGDEVGSENYNDYLNSAKDSIPFIRTTDIINYETDLYPDYFIAQEIYEQLNQDLKAGDVLFTKDGKIGMVGMITKNDKVIVASGFAILRLLDEAKKYNITPEYLFLVLSIKEIGIYASKRRTVIASTIPHLREERLKEIEIPILDKNTIDEITTLVKQAFDLKDKRKQLIKQVRRKMDAYFEL